MFLEWMDALQMVEFIKVCAHVEFAVPICLIFHVLPWGGGHGGQVDPVVGIGNIVEVTTGDVQVGIGGM